MVGITNYDTDPISRTSRIYRNNGGANPTFTDIVAGLPGVDWGSVAWGDYDNDGDLDFVLTGSNSTYSDFISRIYRNSGGVNPTFTDIGASLTAVYFSSVAWGDYDNDGDLDLLLTGFSQPPNAACISRVYANSGGANPTFSSISAGLQGVYGSVAWGDYDNDGDLDILLTGFPDGSVPVSHIYRNNGMTPNTPPQPPTGLSSNRVGNQVTFSWNASADSQTPLAALSYNLRVGTTPGGSEISSAMAANGNGYRRVVALGNSQQRRARTLTVPPGNYYWSVQAIDGAWAGSPFVTEQDQAADVPVIATSVFESRVMPNPVVGTGTLSFATTRSEKVRVALYDVRGREVRRLMNEADLPAGLHRITFRTGEKTLGAGIYFYRVVAAEGELRGKIALVR
jgi:predicted nucleotidyltransferase